MNDLVREPLVELLVAVQHEPLPLCALLALRHQRGVLVPLEQTRHLDRKWLRLVLTSNKSGLDWTVLRTSQG